MKLLKLSLSLILCAGLGIKVVYSQDSLNVSMISKTPTCSDRFRGIDIQGDYLFAASSSTGLWIYDISELPSYTLVSIFDTPGTATDVAVSGDYAYISDGEHSGLRIIDISDINNPEEVSSVPPTSEMRKICYNNDLIFIEDGRHGDDSLRVFDVSDPENPSQISVLEIERRLRDIYISEELLFIADSDGLKIFDISDASNPVLIGSYLDSFIESVRTIDDIAYIGINHKFKVLDISDPSNIVELDSLDIFGWGYDMKITDGYVYLAEGSGSYAHGLSVIDISDPENPSLAGNFYLENYSWYFHYEGFALVDDYALIIDHQQDGLSIIDISDFENIVIESNIPHGYTRRVTLNEDYAYLSGGRKGMFIYDISDLENPAEIGVFPTEGDVRDVFITGDLAHIADGPGGYRIIDISDPENPNELSSYGDNIYVWELAFDSIYVFIPDHRGSLIICDVTDPENIEYISECEVDGTPRDIVKFGNYLYLACEWTGIQIIDVSDVSEPYERASYVDILPANLWLKDSLLFVSTARQHYRYYVFDISNPLNPEIVAEFPVGGHSNGITTYDDYIFFADDLSVLQIFNIADPLNPEVAGYYYDYPSSAIGITVRGDIAFLADRFFLEIYRYDLPLPPSPFGLVEPEDHTLISPDEFSNLTLGWEQSVEYNVEDTVSYDIEFTATIGDYDTLLTYQELENNQVDINFPDSLSWTEWEERIAVHWSVKATANSDTTACDEEFLFTVDSNSETREFNQPDLPEKFEIVNTYPNPFNSTINVHIALPYISSLKLELYDILGRLSASMMKESNNAGFHNIPLHVTAPSGLYFLKVCTGRNDFKVTKVILLK